MLKLFFALMVSLGLIAVVTVAGAVEPEREAANAAVAYIESLQNADGGFPGFGDESSPGVTLDAVFALVAAGRDPTAVTVDGNSPFDYLAAHAAEYAEDPGAAAKLALALFVTSAHSDLTNFGGMDILRPMREAFDLETGRFGLDLFDQCLMILASVEFLGGATPPVPVLAEYLRSVQQEDGGWEFGEGFGSDSNTTALAVQALIAAGTAVDDPAVVAALDYFQAIQDASGGFGFLPDTEPDAQSTAFVIQALVAAGEDIDGARWAPGGNTPMEALLAFQNPATGAFQFAGEDSPFATYQSVPGLMLAPFPHLETRTADGPQAPPAVARPRPLSPPVVDGLPPTGLGSSRDGQPWWAIAALLSAGGAGAAGAAAAWRRER